MNISNYFERTTKIGCCILAGGRGLRAGGIDKSQLVVDGKSFLEHIISELPDKYELKISYNKNTLPEMYNKYVIKDIVQGIGPLGGIYTALKKMDSDIVLVVPCDMPFFEIKLAKILESKFNNFYDAIVWKAGDGKIHPLCGLYSKTCIPVIEEFIKNKNYKITDILNNVSTLYLDAAEENIHDKLFTNINTLDNYYKLK